MENSNDSAISILSALFTQYTFPMRSAEWNFYARPYRVVKFFEYVILFDVLRDNFRISMRLKMTWHRNSIRHNPRSVCFSRLQILVLHYSAQFSIAKGWI